LGGVAPRSFTKQSKHVTDKPLYSKDSVRFPKGKPPNRSPK
jgi:hypothetical protein